MLCARGGDVWNWARFLCEALLVARDGAVAEARSRRGRCSEDEARGCVGELMIVETKVGSSSVRGAGPYDETRRFGYWSSDG